MPNWFYGKIRYQQPIDDSNVGTRNEEFIRQKTVTEAYLLDAVSYTEAEARLYEILGGGYARPIVYDMSKLPKGYTIERVIWEAKQAGNVIVKKAEADSVTVNRLSDFEIVSLREMKFADVLFDEQGGGETWYKVKTLFILEDEKTGKQKKTPSLSLIHANNPKDAYERMSKVLKKALNPFDITDVNTTDILDVFPFMSEAPISVDGPFNLPNENNDDEI